MMNTPPPTRVSIEPAVAGPWIIRLRWWAVAGLVAALLVGTLSGTDLPALLLVTLAILTAASNLWIPRWLRRADRVDPGLTLLLVGDTLLLTVFLMASGGPENPFSLLYVVLIAMATLLASNRAAWGLALLCIVCYAAQFLWHAENHTWHSAVSVPGLMEPVRLHLAGMWTAVTIVAIAITYLIRGILLSLGERGAALRSAQATADRNERLAALTTLAAGSAHELGSPLGTIAVAAREIERNVDTDRPGDIAEDARMIRAETERCREILDRMSAAGAEDAAPVTGECTGPELELLLRRELSEESSDLQFCIDPADLRIGIHPDRLLDLLRPLVSNAVCENPSGRPIEVIVRVSEGALRMTVRDHGEAAEPERLARAVEPFFTTKPPGRGTGLGLHVVRLLAESLGGRLELEPVHAEGSGAGTIAAIVLPTDWVLDELPGAS